MVITYLQATGRPRCGKENTAMAMTL